jgi:hypothetical protein
VSVQRLAHLRKEPMTTIMLDLRGSRNVISPVASRMRMRAIVVGWVGFQVGGVPYPKRIPRVERAEHMAVVVLILDGMKADDSGCAVATTHKVLKHVVQDV